MPKNTFGLSSNFEKAMARAVKAAHKELQALAKAHGVSIRVDKMMSASLQNGTVVHAPIRGIEKYSNSDFSVGAPIQLVIINSTRGAIPNGSYVVKAKYRPQAKSGTAIFVNHVGKVVAQQKLIVRTRAQSAVIFPDAYSKRGPQRIPIITSSHLFSVGPHYVDCSGWQPFRTIYYPVW